MGGRKVAPAEADLGHSRLSFERIHHRGSTLNAYLDSSALVKLFVREDGSDSVGSLVGTASFVATSRISYVETVAAFARAGREGRFTPSQEKQAGRNLDRHWRGIAIVEVDDPLTREAARLCRQLTLRAADAIHLASAAVLANDEEIVFACWDRRLAESAAQIGFSILP